MKLDVFDIEKNKKSEFEIADELLKIEVKDDLIHDVILAYLQNQHIGSSNTLGRGQVRGGGKKPWKQKGTGRARHGSIRSPIWRGGGVTFGPKPFKARIEVSKVSKKKALQAVIAGKIKDNELVILDDFTVKQAKTKEVFQALKKLGIAGNKALIITDKADLNLLRASRNISKFLLMTADTANVYEIISHPKVFVTEKAMEKIVERMK